MKRLLLIPLAMLVAPASALAAEVPPKGMPQFAFGNPLTTSQILWMCVIFAVLYGILAAWALPALGSVIENRARRIREDLDRAKVAKSEADAAVTELRAATQRARAEAQTAIVQATSAARGEASRQAATLNERLEGELKAAEARIAAAQNKAMSALGEAAKETAEVIIERLTGRKPSLEAVEGAIRQAIAARGS